VYFQRCELLHRANELPGELKTPVVLRQTERQEAAFQSERAEMTRYTKELRRS
jgi:hypothetical protein